MIMMASEKIVLKNREEITDYVTSKILELAEKSIADRKRFTLGVSGGSVIDILSEGLIKRRPKKNIEWEKWHVFMCDERLVPVDDGDNTYGQYKTKLIDQLKCEKSWYPVDTSLSNPEDCATSYEKTLREVFVNEKFPAFDLLLLGMGPDGHTCSLFPNHPLLREKELWIASIKDSPKPPPCRVTMTLPVVNNSRNAMFISPGSSKADTIKTIFSSDEETLPAQMVKPTNGTLFWVLDESAASKL